MIRRLCRLSLCRTLLWAVLAGCLTAACDRRDLYYGYDNRCDVCFVTDWSRLDTRPSGMTFLFYPKEGGQPLSYITNSVDSVVLSVPVGSYRMIAFNRTVNEFASLGFRHLDDYSTAEVYARQAAPHWMNREDDLPTTYGLEQIAVARIEDITLTEEMRHDYGLMQGPQKPRSQTDAALVKQYRLMPECAAYTTELTVHIHGVQNVRSVRATMNGLAEGYYLGQGHANSTTITHVIDQWEVVRDAGSYSDGYIRTRFVSFGMPVAATAERADGLELVLQSLLQLSILLVDNTTVVDFSYDVSKRIEINHTELSIVVEVGIPLPDEDPGEAGGEQDPGSLPPSLPTVEDKESSSSGFDAEVSDWEDGGEKDIEL